MTQGRDRGRIAIGLAAVLLSVSISSATPDRLRHVTDDLLGFQDGNCIILQTVHDNLGSYYEKLVEQYFIEKHICGESIEVIKIVKDTKEASLASILAKNLRDSFEPALPSIEPDPYIPHEIIKGRYLKGPNWNIDLTRYVQKELLPCTFLRAVDYYYHDRIFFFTIDLMDPEGISFYRKVIGIPEEQYSV